MKLFIRLIRYIRRYQSKRLMLEDNQLIMHDSITGKDVVATLLSSNEDTGVIMGKAENGTFLSNKVSEIIKINTDENIARVLGNE